MKKYSLVLIVVFLVQILLSNILSIGDIRPDFLIIFIIYFAVNFGSFKGVLAGFSIGLIISYFDSGVIIGLLPLTYSIVGYLGGYLKDKSYRLGQSQFILISLLIIMFSFFIYTYFNYEYLFYNEFSTFLLTWFNTTIYTLSILAILQFIVPLRRI